MGFQDAEIFFGGTNMLKILPLEKTDATCIVRWNNEKSANFLQQWAGRGYEYPITEKQIINRLDVEASSNYKVYKIVLHDDMIGTIELMNIDNEAKTAVVGRFLLNPEFTGRGYGTEALTRFVAFVFNDFGLQKISLNVFDFNKSALRCYEKVGFKAVHKEIRPNGWVAIRMEIVNTVV